MSRLSNAPLIEVIFELRWGQRGKNPGDWNLGAEDTAVFPGLFKTAAQEAGYPHVEAVGPAGVPATMPIPFVPTLRFRREPSRWPCLQIGAGVLTANITNDLYEGWHSFEPVVLEAVSLLGRHPAGLAGLPAIGVSLTYLDGFICPEGVEPRRFLRENLNVGLALGPPDNSAAPELPVDNLGFWFTSRIGAPKGRLVCRVDQGMVNNQKGLIMRTDVRSTGQDSPPLDEARLQEWLRAAHGLHDKFFFEWVLKPAYRETLR